MWDKVRLLTRVRRGACFGQPLAVSSSEQSCSALVEDELDVEELVVALWKNKLGVKVSRLCGGES